MFGRSLCVCIELGSRAPSREQRENKQSREQGKNVIAFNKVLLLFGNLFSPLCRANLCSFWHLLCQRCVCVSERTKSCTIRFCQNSIWPACDLCIYCIYPLTCLAKVAVDRKKNHAIVRLHGPIQLSNYLEEQFIEINNTVFAAASSHVNSLRMNAMNAYAKAGEVMSWRMQNAILISSSKNPWTWLIRFEGELALLYDRRHLNWRIFAGVQ